MIALITGGMALLGNMCVSATSNSKTMYRIDQLEKKVEKHNNLIERVYVIERDMKTAFNRVDELREDIRDLEHGE